MSGGGARERAEGGGGLCLIMSAVGDYPMLINAHVPSLPSLLEL